MGADFTFQVVPACDLTDERVARLRSLVESFTPEEMTSFDLNGWGDDNIEDYRERLLRAVSELKDACEGRESSVIYLHDGYPCYITGGMSWGDIPTEAYEVFELIQNCHPLYAQMEQWAQQDWDADKAKRGISS